MLFLCLLLLGDWHVPHPHAEGTPDPGAPRSIPHTMERAGFPQCVSPHARTSKSPHAIGYYVGGGAIATHGDPRQPHQGTWGYDDTGLPWHRDRVRLGFWNGRHAQGGRGAYRTDGQHIPDPIAGLVGRLRRGHSEEQAAHGPGEHVPPAGDSSAPH